ncbi:MAG TPA: HEAT repeat domain-containing protein, partial [Methanomicrobiales archaeon]|nr:HEAT repeat domain-containing protein [Methanomicrobiales archaeon]
MAQITSYKSTILFVAIAIAVLLELIVHLYLGVGVVYTHFFYVVLVLAGLWYYWRAVYVAIGLSALYILDEYLLIGFVSTDVLIRAAMFVVVAFVVGYLSWLIAREQTNLIHYITERTLQFRQSTAIRSGEARDTRNQPEITERIRDLKEQRSYEELVRGMKSSNPDIRNTAAERLGELKNPHGVTILTQSLSDPDPGVRWKAAEALGKIGEPAMESLVLALHEKDADVRWKAAVALGDIGDPRAMGPLVQALSDEDWYVRSRAAYALGRIGGPAEPVLMNLLSEGSSMERYGAALGLSKIGSE